MVAPVLTKQAVGYIRVSGPDQAGERHVSLETQEADFRRYCSINGLRPCATFLDIASGRRDDRAQYQAMLRYLDDHDVDVVAVIWLDRFRRNPHEILRRYWALEERGVTVVSTNKDLKEELLLLMRAGIAGAESRRIGERTKYNMIKAAEKGRHMARAPYRYRRVKTGDITAFLDGVSRQGLVARTRRMVLTLVPALT